MLSSKKIKLLRYQYQRQILIFSVEKYNSTHKQLWNTFVSTSKNATFLFDRDFMEYHQDRFEDASVLVYKNQKLTAIFPANFDLGKVYSHQGLSYGGLITAKQIKLNDFIECFKAILKHYKKQGCKSIQIKQLPSIYTAFPNDEMNYLLFVLKATLIKRETLSVINLSRKVKYSRARLEGNKRAKKHNLVIREVKEFSEFWNQILLPNLKAKHATKPVHSLEDIEILHKKFPKHIRQFNVYNNQNIVAGTTIFETKNVAHSQYISGNEEKNDLGSLDALHLHLIDYVFKDKAYFDFGSSNVNQGKQINEGLNFWKEGFGARTVTHDFYEFSLDIIDKLDTILV